MTVVNNILLAVIIASGAAALLFVARGLLIRSTQKSKPYGVARQEARHEMQVSFLRGGFLVFLTLILVGIYGLAPGQSPATPQVTAAPTNQSTGTAEGATPTATGSPVQAATPAIEPTAVELTGTVMVTATTTATATAAPTEAPTTATAVVNSPNGLWLREAPGGSQELELIAHQTELTLLPGRETDGDLEWQQVRTPAGNEGWVAADFLTYQD